MNPPAPRNPSSPGPHPSSFSHESLLEFCGLIGAVLAGAFASGLTILFGEAITGTSGADAYGSYPILHFMGGLIFSLPLSILGIAAWWAFSKRIQPGLFSVPSFFVPIAALIVGLNIPPMYP